MPAGKYVLGLEIEYPGAFATSSAQFEVLEMEPLLSTKDSLVYTILTIGIIFLVILIIIVWVMKRKRSYRVKGKTR